MADRSLLVFVKRVFRERSKGRTLTALVAALNEDGIAAPKGGRVEVLARAEWITELGDQIEAARDNA